MSSIFKYIRKFFLFLFLFFAFGKTIAQTVDFQKSYDTLGCYYSSGVAEYFDKGFIVCGSSHTSNANDAAILRLDSVGNIIWEKNYGTSAIDGAKNVLISPDSCILIAGVYQSVAAWDRLLWVFKLDHAGNMIWSHTYRISGGAEPTAFYYSNDGKLVISGFCVQNQSMASDAFLVECDTSGILIWSKIYNVPFGDSKGSTSLSDAGFSSWFIRISRHKRWISY